MTMALTQFKEVDTQPRDTVFDAMAGRRIPLSGQEPTIQLPGRGRMLDRYLEHLPVKTAMTMLERGQAVEVNDGVHVTLKKDDEELKTFFERGRQARREDRGHYPLSEDGELLAKVCGSTPSRQSELMTAWKSGWEAEDAEIARQGTQAP